MKKLLLIVLIVACFVLQAMSQDTTAFIISKAQYTEVCKYQLLLQLYKRSPANYTKKAGAIIENPNPDISQFPAYSPHALTMDELLKWYRYKSIEKRYYLCKRRPKNWKFFKGWSYRELKNDLK
jgi:hypothetical protein